LVYFYRFGILYQEESGHPAAVPILCTITAATALVFTAVAS
jgi:hypothetical protein